ncbi:EAL domain-containing protein [Sphingomonas sp. PB4P5]
MEGLPIAGDTAYDRVLDHVNSPTTMAADGAQLDRDLLNGPSARPWQFLCLGEIVNFAPLRRYLGRGRADALTHAVRARIALTLPTARVTVVGRTLIEFALDGDSLSDLEAALSCLSAAFDLPFELDGQRHDLTMLFAGAAAPTDNTEDVRLAEEAEGALEQARGEHQVVIRDLSAGTPAFDRLTLSRELSPAIANREMFLQYQPKVHLRRQEIVSAEALVRWNHPIRGLVLPGDFIMLAEEIGEIGPLTLWTLDQVIHDQKRMAADGHDLTVFINISGQLLADAAFVETACATVRDSGAKIGFEITETSVIRDPDIAIRHLQVFADVGITIAIDDYGAGLSSLAYLKQLPARELKIDKMFVLQLTSSNRDPLIVRSTIDLAHALEMEVTAEGVETQAALALLTVMGCDMVQGYLISRPISFDAFCQYLRDDKLKPMEVERESMLRRPASFWKASEAG